MKILKKKIKRIGYVGFLILFLSCEKQLPIIELCKDCGSVKDKDYFQKRHHVPSYFDYKQALCCSKQTGKPILVVFSAWSSVKVDTLEKYIFKNKKVLDFLNGNYITTHLYVDDMRKLSSSERYTSKVSKNKIVKTLGGVNVDLQTKILASGHQPAICVVNSEGKIIERDIKYTKKPEVFLKQLKDVLR